jgi:hypothetical protein
MSYDWEKGAEEEEKDSGPLTKKHKILIIRLT